MLSAVAATRVGKYQLSGQTHQVGGVPAYASIDLASGMPVTIYVYDPDGSAEKVTRLFSFGIPGVLDQGVDQAGRGYLVVPAVTEFPVLEPGTLTEAIAAAFGAQALEAMEAAAGVSLVHGAITPGVWRRNGQHLLLEGYGLPGLAEDDGYRAPEVRVRGDVTVASDIYAWARCLNALVTGAPQDGVSGALAAVIEPCLAVNPEERPSLHRLLPEVLALSGQSPQSLASGRTTEADGVLDLQGTDPGLTPQAADPTRSEQPSGGNWPGSPLPASGGGLDLDLGPTIGPPPELRQQGAEAEAPRTVGPVTEPASGTIIFTEADFDGLDREPATEIPMGSVHVVTDPPGAGMLVDGAAQPGVTPMTLRLTVGLHKVTVRRDGYETKTRDIEIFEGERTVRAVLRPEGALPPPRLRPAARPGSDRPVTARRTRAGAGLSLPNWAWGAIVTLVAGALAVVIFTGRPQAPAPLPTPPPAVALPRPHHISFTGTPSVGIKLFIVDAPAGSGIRRGDQLANLPQSVAFNFAGDYIVRAVLADCTAPLIEFNVPRNRNISVAMACP